MSASFSGFDLDISHNIAFRNSSTQPKKRDKKAYTGPYEYLSVIFKHLINPINFGTKMGFENMSHLAFNMDHLSNLKNPDMNNVMGIDFAIRDWIDDSDYMLPRICEEFPKNSMAFTRKDGQKPWGNISAPVHMDPYMDENLMRLNMKAYQRGVWYYTQYPQTDHNEFAGLPNVWRGIQTMMGLEYRPGFFINIYNRLRSLEYSDKNSTRDKFDL
jgi:hypothetical protein